jgi:hypothetical protein
MAEPCLIALEGTCRRPDKQGKHLAVLHSNGCQVMEILQAATKGNQATTYYLDKMNSDNGHMVAAKPWALLTGESMS